ncbi:hypothetical protein PSENEW3_00003201 [Picochlorum sp. SENEW3]|nr:hypothetical protein PSENEW3_00003201 [Picochlorum sp. SENEW3]
MFSSYSETAGSVRGNDRVDTKIYTIQVNFDGALCHSFSVSKALPVHKRSKTILNQLSELDIDEDSALLDSLKITTTQGGERIPVPDRVKASTIDSFLRMVTLSSMLSQTTYSDISLWFKTAGAQVTPATCTPKVEPQNIDKPSEKDEEFIRLYVERLAKYLGLNNTAHSEALATVVQSCLSIIMNDDGKDYSVIEDTLNALQANSRRRSTCKEQSNEKVPASKGKYVSSSKPSPGSFRAQNDAKFKVDPCIYTLYNVNTLLSNLSKIQAKDVENMFTYTAVLVFSGEASHCNLKLTDLSDSLRQALLLDKVTPSIK